MSAKDLILRLHQHRQWVNRQLLDAARQLSDEQLRKSFPIGQGSIWKSLCHLYAAEYVWLAALLGDERPVVPGDVADKLPGNQEAEGTMVSLEELVQKWAELDRKWQAYLEGVADEDLAELIYKISTSSGYGKRHGTRRSDVLLHVATHAQYTTAQVVNMMRQVGMSSLPDAMLITLARSERAAEDLPVAAKE